MMSSSGPFLPGRLDFGLFRQDACNKLRALLEEEFGSKAIVWDEQLTRPMGLVAEYALLKELGVVKMVSLNAGLPLQTDVSSVVFLVRPELALMNLVAENVSREEQMGGRRKRLIMCFVPARSAACERALEEHGVLNTFSQVTSLDVRLFPLDSDVLSMEYPSWFMESTLENDVTCYFRAAQALSDLQAKFGLIPNIYGKGDAAKKVYECMVRLDRERCREEDVARPSEIDSLLLIDRSVDLLTPMATQLTYEGLIDETFGIDNNTVRIPSDKFARTEGGPMETSASFKQFVLSSAEELYAEIRDKNFNAVGPSLSKKAKYISAQYEERHLGDIGDMKNFVRNILPNIKAAKESLTLHTTIAELIKERTDEKSFLDSLQVEQEFMNAIDVDRVHPYIEELIAKKAPFNRVLRLVSMQCWCGGRARLLERYRRDLLQTYGFQQALTLDSLQRCGLLGDSTAPANFAGLQRQLLLTVEDVSEQEPSDVAYTYSGYAPISVRLAQYLCHPGWRSVSDALSQLPGYTLQEQQQLVVGGSSSATAARNNRLTLVVFLGGVTFAELSALRFLSSQEDAPTEYVVVTTKVITGNSLLESVSLS